MNRITLLCAVLSSLTLLVGCSQRDIAYMRPQHCADSSNVAYFSEANNLMAMQPRCAVPSTPELKEKA